MLTRPAELALAALLVVAPLGAQTVCSVRWTAAGSDEERHARVMQQVGATPVHQWSLRSFGPRELSVFLTDSVWPNTRVIRQACDTNRRVWLLPQRVSAVYNSGFPFGGNDGPIWAGRGLTLSVDAGVEGRFGLVSFRVDPVAFTTDNADFNVRPNGLSGERAYADWRNPSAIDLPQRFGDGRYTRVDPGQSEVRLDWSNLALGVSSANEHWGPSSDHPVILGGNAAGIPRVFVGTSRPVSVWRAGKIHGRIFYGKLSESDIAPVQSKSTSRLASGFAGVIQPAALPGLELGVGRFFHVLQDKFALTPGEISRPFGVLFKGNRSLAEEPENQIASAFARLVFPKDGLEVYGEFGREDHNWDLKEFWQFLDHDSAYLLGAQKSWRVNSELRSLRVEVLNSRITHLALSSNQQPLYTHGEVSQGHTHLGQALGSASGYGGGAAIVAFDRYTPRGRVTASWERLQFGDVRTGGAAPELVLSDIAHVWRINQLRRARHAEVQFGLGLIYEMNRHPHVDEWAVQTTFTLSRRTSP